MKLVIDSYLLCYLLNISTYYLYTQRGWHISERPYSFTYLRRCTGMLKNPYPDQEGNKLMFLSKWREFPSTPCLAGKKKLDDSSRLGVVKIARGLTCFRACFLPCRARDLSAPGIILMTASLNSKIPNLPRSPSRARMWSQTYFSFCRRPKDAYVVE
jgi:hypothetical protein